MPSEARNCAQQTLRRVFEQGAYAERAFHSLAGGLDQRDRALAMRIAYGAIQRAGTLDRAIEQLAKRPVSRLDGAVLAALRTGLYELLYLDSAAAHAVVDDSVELVKRSGSHGHGLVNAALRRAAREPAELLAGLHERTPEAAAIMHSHPPWLAQMWWEQLGAEQARALMAADNEPAETAIRVNTLLATPAELATALPVRRRERPKARPGQALPEESLGKTPPEDPLGQALPGQTPPEDPLGQALPGQTPPEDPLGQALPGQTPPEDLYSQELLGLPLPEALVLDGPFDLLGSPQWLAGELVAQSRAAMLVSRVLAPQSGERVLDLCAAPGGKSTHIAALMGGEGEVIAVEREPGRARQLRETVARMRTASVRVLEADAERPLQELAGERFDRVLLDAPCSGLGTLQSRPDLRWRASPERIEQLVAVQARMLAVAAEAVCAGGTLVYSTCTISRAENEQQIESFLQAHPDFAPEPPTASGQHGEPFLTTLPSRDFTAGFFIARLSRG